MGLIKEINEALDKRITKQQREETVLIENFTTIFKKPELYDEVFETVDEFLTALAQTIKSGQGIDPAQAAPVAAKLATLEIIAGDGTRGAALSALPTTFQGDAATKLSSIIQNVGGKVDTSGKIDSLLVQTGNASAKSATTANIQLLSNLQKVDQKTREAKANQVMGMASKFKQLAAKLASMQPGGAQSNQQQTPAQATAPTI